MKNELNNLNQMPTSNGVGFNNVVNTNETIVTETVVVKPYKLRKLKASELFPMLNILKKIGFKNFTGLLQNKDVRNLIGKLKNGQTGEIAEDELVGVGSIVFEIAQIILDGAINCENELFTILSNVSNLTVENVKELDIDILFEMIVDLIKENKDFIKAVSKLF